MRIIRDTAACPPDYRNAVVALGNFDGVHRGHQAILNQCKAIAKAANAKAMAMTFYPHPREFFNPNAESLRICSLRQKIESFEAIGMDGVFLMRFNRRFASLSATDFLSQILHSDLKVRHVVTGENFAFGKGRQGDTKFLADTAHRLGFEFTTCRSVVDEHGLTISSSAIRKLLAEGNMQEAALLLGRPYAIEGHVRHGDKRGREFGYPTANISLAGLFKPRFGIYAVRIKVDGVWYNGAANLGIRPMFQIDQPLLEAHLFDFNQPLYGKRLTVELLDYVREERAFANLNALKVQIADDCAVAKTLLQKHAKR